MNESAKSIRDRLVSNDAKVAVVGAGYVGLCTGVSLAARGCDITFVDYDKRRVELINQGTAPIYEPGLGEQLENLVESGHLRAITSYNELVDFDAIIICVNTPIDSDYKVDLKYLVSAVDSIISLNIRDKLIVIRSTVPPQTIRNVVSTRMDGSDLKIGENVYLSVVPERLSEGHALQDMIGNPMIIGLNDEASELATTALFSRLGVELIVTTWEEAELSKLADNLWIDLNIALANELAMVSEKIGADVRKVIKAANTLKKGDSFVNILRPGSGVGGSCLPKDPFILKEFARRVDVEMKIPDVSRSVNDSMPGHLFQMAAENLKSLEDTRVTLLGLSFNADSGDMRDTPSIPLLKMLHDAGAAISVYDPLVSDVDFSVLAGVKIIKSKEEFLKSLNETDILFVVTAHSGFTQIRNDILSGMKGKMIIDGRYLFETCQAEKYGVTYRAVGVGNN